MTCCLFIEVEGLLVIDHLGRMLLRDMAYICRLCLVIFDEFVKRHICKELHLIFRILMPIEQGLTYIKANSSIVQARSCRLYIRTYISPRCVVASAQHVTYLPPPPLPSPCDW